MYLIINTAPIDKIEIILAKTKDDFKLKVMPGERKQSEKLLIGITAFLKVNKLKLDQLKGIGAVSGPGRFTSIRIGVTLANVLGYGLGIPVAGIEAGEYKNYPELTKRIIIRLSHAKPGMVVLPVYNAEPNITRAKPKK